MPVQSSLLLDISLPKPIVLPALHLTGLYACMLGIDYVLLRNQHRLPISKTTLRLGMTSIHAIVPLAIVSPLQPNNVTFAAVPWFLASYSAYLPTDQFSLSQWIRALYNTIVDRNPPNAKTNVHVQGIIKTLRGMMKLAVLYFGIEPLLPEYPETMLAHAWLSRESLLDTFLFGLKAYLVLGAVDVTTGLAQAVTGWSMVDMFNSPLLATSPRDFWRYLNNSAGLTNVTSVSNIFFSNRWNITVRNLLHNLVFTSSNSEKKKDEEKLKKDQAGYFSTNASRGFMAFFVSGAFHELIICSVCRRVTLENFAFFTLHGLICTLEVKYFGNLTKQKPAGWKRVIRIAAQLSFMTLTGRLFLSPFLRTRFTEVLPLTKF